MWLSSNSQERGRGWADRVGAGPMPTNKIGGGRDGPDENRAFRPRREGARAGDGEAPAPRCQPRRGGRAPREGRGRTPQTRAGSRCARRRSGGQNQGPGREDRPQAEGAERGGGSHRPHALLTGQRTRQRRPETGVDARGRVPGTSREEAGGATAAPSVTLRRDLSGGVGAAGVRQGVARGRDAPQGGVLPAAQTQRLPTCPPGPHKGHSAPRAPRGRLPDDQRCPELEVSTQRGLRAALAPRTGGAGRPGGRGQRRRAARPGATRAAGRPGEAAMLTRGVRGL